jgi:SAM-dependent methyltransferase
MGTQSETTDWYERYYREKGADRNDLLANPGVLFQGFAADRAFIAAVRGCGLDRTSAKVLDVGCGGGTGLALLLRLGFPPQNLSGVDIQEPRIAAARKLVPGTSLSCQDAAGMTFPDGAFDLVFESTMFYQISDEALAARIAREMVRVTRRGGFLILSDWRYAKPRSTTYRAVTAGRIARLFGVPDTARVRRRVRGALVPPLGRFLSHRAPALYFAVHALAPFLVGQITTVLQKAGGR